MAFIYKTTNITNGKIYVGKTSRDDPTYLGSGTILADAISKHGYDNFKKEILEECHDSIVDEREKYWIIKLNARERGVGYNIASGGTGGDTTSQHPEKESIVQKRVHGLKKWHNSLTDEEKTERNSNISKAKSGRSNGREGYSHTDSTIEKMKNVDKSYCKKEEWINAHSEAMVKRRGIPAPNRKPVIINEVQYSSMTEAAKCLGFKDKASLYYRIKQGKIKVEYL